MHVKRAPEGTVEFKMARMDIVERCTEVKVSESSQSGQSRPENGYLSDGDLASRLKDTGHHTHDSHAAHSFGGEVRSFNSLILPRYSGVQISATSRTQEARLTK